MAVIHRSVDPQDVGYEFPYTTKCTPYKGYSRTDVSSYSREIVVDFDTRLALNNPTPCSSILMKRIKVEFHLTDGLQRRRIYGIRPKRERS